jgi:hypothetical protein
MESKTSSVPFRGENEFMAEAVFIAKFEGVDDENFPFYCSIYSSVFYGFSLQAVTLHKSVKYLILGK